MSSSRCFTYMTISTIIMVAATLACSQKADSSKPKSVLPNTAEPSSAAVPSGSNSFSPAQHFRKIPLIYVVDSYNPDTFSWTKDINTGIVEGLEKGGLRQGMTYEMVHDTLDAFVNSSPSQLETQGRRILKDIRLKKPDLVLTTDDDALVWVGLKLEDIPVVFNGVNGDPRKYLSSTQIESLEKPGHNITGIYQTTYYSQSLALFKKLSPTARFFGVVTDTTTTGISLLEALKEIAPSALPLKWRKTVVSDQFAQWKQNLNAWQGQVDVVFILSANGVKGEGGTLIPSEQVFDLLNTQSHIPKIACWAIYVQQGVLASAADDGAQQGRLSAILTKQILQGINPGDLPISTPPNGVPALNLKRAKMLNIAVPQELITLLIDQGMIFN